jgi:hypothetical protein
MASYELIDSKVPAPRREVLTQNLERISYILLIAGSILDHGSTMLGLSVGGSLAEANPLVGWMISSDLWLLFDLSMLTSIILLTHLACRRWRNGNAWMLLVYPFLVGVARTAAGLWNLSLLS